MAINCFPEKSQFQKLAFTFHQNPFKKVGISKKFSRKNLIFKNGITDKIVKSPEPKMFLKSRHCKKIFSRKFSVLKIGFSNKYIVSLIFTDLFINFVNNVLAETFYGFIISVRCKYEQAVFIFIDTDWVVAISLEIEVELPFLLIFGSCLILFLKCLLFL